MFALVESGSITKYFAGNKGIVIGDTQYPKSIFTLWSESDRNAIGVYTVTINQTNKKNEKWYTNTNQSFTFADGTATASYGSATPKAHADVTETINGVESTTPGLKTNLIKDLKITVANELAKTDWYITRNTEKSTAIPSAISTHRDAVRTKQASMEAQITGAADTAALETLHTYTTDSDDVQSRPLGELPILEL